MTAYNPTHRLDLIIDMNTVSVTGIPIDFVYSSCTQEPY